MLTWRSPEGGLHPLHDAPAPARAGQPLALPQLGPLSAVALTPPAGPETFLLVWSDAARPDLGSSASDEAPVAVAPSGVARASNPEGASKGAVPVRAYAFSAQAPECLTYTPPDSPVWSVAVTLDHR